MATKPRGREQRKLPRLREARENAALTQAELAAMVGLHQVSISELERGRRGAHPSTVRKLANALGVLPKTLYEAPEEADES